MLKDFYIQVDEVGRIRDCIEYPYEDYVPVKADTPLPYNILGGAYELREGQILYHPEWDKNAEIEALKTELAEMQEALAAEMFGG